MVLWKKKISARRQHVRDNISAERFANISRFANSPLPAALLVLVVFVVAVIALLGIDTSEGQFFRPEADVFKPWPEISALAAIVILVCSGAALYIHHYQNRIISRPARIVALAVLFLVLLVLTKVGSLYPEWVYLATGSAVTSAIILTIAYNQRFAIGITLFYCILACFAVGRIAGVISTRGAVLTSDFPPPCVTSVLSTESLRNLLCSPNLLIPASPILVLSNFNSANPSMARM